MDSLATISLSGFFNCPMNTIYWVSFESGSNSYYLFKSTAINL